MGFFVHFWILRNNSLFSVFWLDIRLSKRRNNEYPNALKYTFPFFCSKKLNMFYYIFYRLHQFFMYLELKRGPKEIATPIIMTVGFIFFLLTFISFLILMLSRDFFMLPSLNKVEILVPCAIVFGALYFFFSNGDTTDRIL